MASRKTGGGGPRALSFLAEGGGLGWRVQPRSRPMGSVNGARTGAATAKPPSPAASRLAKAPGPMTASEGHGRPPPVPLPQAGGGGRPASLLPRRGWVGVEGANRPATRATAPAAGHGVAARWPLCGALLVTRGPFADPLPLDPPPAGREGEVYTLLPLRGRRVGWRVPWLGTIVLLRSVRRAACLGNRPPDVRPPPRSPSREAGGGGVLPPPSPGEEGWVDGAMARHHRASPVGPSCSMPRLETAGCPPSPLIPLPLEGRRVPARALAECAWSVFTGPGDGQLGFCPRPSAQPRTQARCLP